MPRGRPFRLAYFVSHPIQYQAPLLRRIALEPEVDLTVFFSSDFSLQAYRDEGFGVPVAWDIPLVDGYRHEFLPRLWGSGTRTVNRGFVRRLRGFDAVWIHGYTSANSLHALLAAKAGGVPVLLRAEGWLHDRERSRLKLKAKTLFFGAVRHLVDAVLPIGTRNAEYWRHYLGDDVAQFAMPYAVDNVYFQQRCRDAAVSREKFRAGLGLERGRKVILYASKLQRRKRCSDLVEAFNFFAAGVIGPRPYLLIVGDGEERERLEQQAAGSEDIRFCGFRNQSELPRFFDLADVFVLPAEHEPWGLVVNEAMNAGRPIIVSDAIGCQVDLVRDGVEGCVYPVGDRVALANAIGRVLQTPEVAEAMGAKASERISEWGFEQDVEGLLGALTYVAGRRVQGGSLKL